MRSVVDSAEVMADVDEAKEKWARTEDALVNGILGSIA